MKKESMRKYTLLGLVLVAASAVTAAVLPKTEEVKKVNGVLQDTTGPGADLTCTDGTGGQCTLTVTQAGDGQNGVGSRTSEGGAVTSSITDSLGIKVKTISSDNNATVNNIHTSVSPD